MSVSFNGLSLTVRDSSGATKLQITDFALNWANEVSENDPALDWFVFVFDARDKEFGLLYSDALREALGLENTYYQLVAPKNDVVPVVANAEIDYEKIKQDVIQMIPSQGAIDYQDLAERISKIMGVAEGSPQAEAPVIVQSLSEEEKQTLIEKTVETTKSQLTEKLTRELTFSITNAVTKQVLADLPKYSTGDSLSMSESEISAVVEAKASELVAKQLPMLEEKIAQFFQEKSGPLQSSFESLQSDIQKSLSDLKIVQADISSKKQAIEDQVAFFTSEKQKATELSAQHAESSQQVHESIEYSIAELKQLDQGISDRLEQNTLADNQRLERLNAAEKTLTEKFVSLEALVKTTNELSASSRQSITDSAEKAQKETNAILADLRFELEKASGAEKLMQFEMSLQTLQEAVNLLPKTAGDTSAVEKSVAELSQVVDQLRIQVNTNSEKLNQPVVQPVAVAEVDAEEEIIADEFADDMGGMP